METCTIRRPDDFHFHGRNGALLQQVVPEIATYAARAIMMPNTRPRAIRTYEDVIWYREEIVSALETTPYKHQFGPLMTIEITDNTTPKMVAPAFHAGAVAGKVYPRGVTTNSDEGLSDFRSKRIFEVFRVMEEMGMLLLIHGELDQPEILVTKREEVFLPTLVMLAEKFPDLKIVLEHVSSKIGVDTVMQLGENVAATITAHHLWLTLNDVAGDKLQPHNMCKPIPKDFPDRKGLIQAAISGNRKFFYGSDSAIHTKENKECAQGACGVYSAPVALSVLAEIFEAEEALENLENFISCFGAKFYDLPLNEGTITLAKEDWEVPEQIGSAVPFLAGTTRHWKLI